MLDSVDKLLTNMDELEQSSQNTIEAAKKTIAQLEKEFKEYSSVEQLKNELKLLNKKYRELEEECQIKEEKIDSLERKIQSDKEYFQQRLEISEKHIKTLENSILSNKRSSEILQKSEIETEQKRTSINRTYSNFSLLQNSVKVEENLSSSSVQTLLQSQMEIVSRKNIEINDLKMELQKSKDTLAELQNSIVKNSGKPVGVSPDMSDQLEDIKFRFFIIFVVLRIFFNEFFFLAKVFLCIGFGN